MAPLSAEPGAFDLDRSLRTGSLATGVVVGALIGLAVQVGAPLLESLLLMAVLGFFSGVPLGYLSSDRSNALRLAVLAAGGAAAGALVTALGVGIALSAGVADIVRSAALVCAFAGVTSLVFLTLGALLGRRAGSPGYRRAEPEPDEPQG